MIKIVRGVYGFMDKGGIVRPKTEADEPFELTPEQEERLVRLGIAEYVGNVEDTEQEPEQEETEQEDTEQEPIGFDETPPVDLSTLSVKELREIGKEYGLTFKVGTSKADMVKAITAAQTELITDAEDEDGEPAPVFDATEAVQ
jgi:hypothetical protein